MPTVLMPIGLPGSGKSTWIKNYVASAVDRYFVFGTDMIFTEWGIRDGLNYAEAFNQYDFNEVEKEFKRRIDAAIGDGVNIIWDQTNLTRKSRAKKLNRFPSTYKRVGVWLNTPFEVVQQRLVTPDRMAEGKKIPHGVIANMLSTYEPPLAEEFDELLIVTP